MNKGFYPDFSNLLDVLHNRRPGRLPLYEHHIDPPFVSKVMGRNIVLQGDKKNDYDDYYKSLIGFWKAHTYDGFDYEAAICDIFPGHGAIMGGRPGPIQNRQDFSIYPFGDIPKIFWETYTPHLEAVRNTLPPGMKAFGGCGYGIFESAQDLVGFEQLCLMQFMDPELFRDLFNKIGELYSVLWKKMVKDYSDIFVFFRMGDDLGHKTSTMLSPGIIREHIIPQYKKVIEIVHSAGKKFLLHSCGNIFSIMDDILETGIDAKHSNEDQIAPFDKWIDLYSPKIGLFGGIDLNTLILNDYDEVFRIVKENGFRFRQKARGYGLGSGNSIPEYVPVEGFMAMVDAVKEIRRLEDQ
ncbi:MAG: hypothetical protein JXA03_13795 [Bacteroidales bacterium]|nr:hypothetical protein [Bacteroidales bacterium]